MDEKEIKKFTDELCELIINTLMSESYELKQLKKTLDFAISNYVLDPDIHKIAYETNTDYKSFYDKMTDDFKKIVEEKHKIIKPLKMVVKFQNTMVHMSTFGLTKLLDKSPKKIVKSNTFIDVMRYLNNVIDS